MAYILKRMPVTNLDRVIEFELGGEKFVRRLVMTVHEIGEEISVASPVGLHLANAKPGAVFQINVANECSVGKVLSVSGSPA